MGDDDKSSSSTSLIRPSKQRVMLTPAPAEEKKAEFTSMVVEDMSLDELLLQGRASRTDSMFEKGKRPDAKTRRTSQYFDITRRPSKMRGLDGKDPDMNKARLWQAFNELEWKDESERKYVFQSYENLKAVYMQKHGDKFAESPTSAAPPTGFRPREDSSILMGQGLAKIREEHRLAVQKSMQVSNKHSGYVYVHLSILKPKMPLTLSYVTKLMEEFRLGRICHDATMYELLARAIPMLQALPNIVPLRIHEGCNLTICGDIHGQLEDFLTIFELNGLPSEQNQYLFNGDFVDRGPHSCEVMLLMIAFKLLYPNAMHLNRGNHEARDMNVQHGFEQECLAKYTNVAFDTFCHMFSVLPLACLVENKVLVIHGGCSWQDDITIEEISKIDRFHDVVPEDTLFEDLLWADPCADNGRFESDRGCGLSFGPDVCQNFLDTNGLDCIIRSHECVDKGYEIWFGGALITIFSASNYCGIAGNQGAIIIMGPDRVPKYVTYYATPLDELVTQSIDRSNLENGVVSKLFARICSARLALMDYYRQHSVKDSRIISRNVWAAGMVQVLGLDIDFLAFGPLIGLPVYGVDGKERGDINYVSYLARFRPIHRGSATSHSSPNPLFMDENEDASTSSAAAAADPPDVSKVSLKDNPEKQRAAEEASVLLSEVNTLMFAHRYELESLFRFFDLDGTGVITANELRDGLMSLGQVLGKNLTPQQLESAVELIDRENSGSVNYQAFFQGFRAAGFSTENTMMSANLMMDRKEKQDCIDLANDIISSLTAQLGCQLVWSKQGVARLSAVTPGMAAAEAGLQENDFILSIGDTAIPDRAAFRTTMLNAQVGGQLHFAIERADRKFVVPVTILGTGKTLEEIETLKRISSGAVFPPDLVWYRQQIKERLQANTDKPPSSVTTTSTTTQPKSTARSTSPSPKVKVEEQKGGKKPTALTTATTTTQKTPVKTPSSPKTGPKSSPKSTPTKAPSSPRLGAKSTPATTTTPKAASERSPSPGRSVVAANSLPASVASSPKKFVRPTPSASTALPVPKVDTKRTASPSRGSSVRPAAKDNVPKGYVKGTKTQNTEGTPTVIAEAAKVDPPVLVLPTPEPVSGAVATAESAVVVSVPKKPPPPPPLTEEMLRSQPSRSA